MPTASISTRTPRIVQSRQNARVRELRAGFARPGLTERGHIAIEGEHLLAEAIAGGLKIAAIFVRSGSEARLHGLPLPDSADILVLPPDVFESAVAVETPQGVAALIEAPRFSLDRILSAESAALLVISAGLQDPGNLGALVRSAAAFGATGFVLLPGTVNPWNQKALRASSGAIFRLGMAAATPAELFPALAVRGIAAWAAVASGGEPLSRQDLTRPSALILGNEGNGVPEEILRRCTGGLTIPTPGPVESLNAAVAGSILMYEASRQREASRVRSAQ